MLGCNIGIPVPREPFSFGGLYGTRSKYGDMDITGDGESYWWLLMIKFLNRVHLDPLAQLNVFAVGAIEFFTNRIKITSKWSTPTVPEYIVASQEGATMMNGGTDHANFAGRM